MSSQKLGHTQTGYVRLAGHCSTSFAEGSPGRSAWAIQAFAPASNRSAYNDPLSVHNRFHVSGLKLPTSPHCWQWWGLDECETRILCRAEV